jgi:hypothetical protein
LLWIKASIANGQLNYFPGISNPVLYKALYKHCLPEPLESLGSAYFDLLGTKNGSLKLNGHHVVGMRHMTAHTDFFALDFRSLFIWRSMVAKIVKAPAISIFEPLSVLNRNINAAVVSRKETSA